MSLVREAVLTDSIHMRTEQGLRLSSREERMDEGEGRPLPI